MELRQKFTEDRVKCEFDELFIDELLDLPYEVSIEIMEQLKINSSKLPEKNFYSQVIGGVVKINPPYFFELEYIKEEGCNPIYLDIIEIECDQYLDYITR